MGSAGSRAWSCFGGSRPRPPGNRNFFDPRKFMKPDLRGEGVVFVCVCFLILFSYVFFFRKVVMFFVV